MRSLNSLAHRVPIALFDFRCVEFFTFKQLAVCVQVEILFSLSAPFAVPSVTEMKIIVNLVIVQVISADVSARDI